MAELRVSISSARAPGAASAISTPQAASRKQEAVIASSEQVRKAAEEGDVVDDVRRRIVQAVGGDGGVGLDLGVGAAERAGAAARRQARGAPARGGDGERVGMVAAVHAAHVGG